MASKLWLGFSVLVLVSLLILACFPIRVEAASLVQTQTGQAAPGTSVSATLTAATSGNMIIVICGATASSTLSMSTTGFTTVINQAGTPSQGIFYKVSTGGETTITCASSVSSRLGIIVFEYSGMVTTSPIDSSNSSTGTSTSPATGSVTTSTSDILLIAGITVVGNDAFSAWTNTFTERADFSNTGAAGSRGTYGGADRQVTATGTYSTTATIGTSSNWRGQIVAFKAIIGSLSVDIVDGSGASVGAPSVSMSAINAGFTCQTPTGTLGTSTQKIRVSNTTAVAAWTVSIAATGGNTSNWTDGTNSFDYNDGSGAPAGCADGADADSLAGRMTINASGGTSTPQAGCNNTGITLGASASFAQGTTDSITLISASSSAGTNCYWDLTNVSVSQTVPSEQRAGSYLINLTITVVAA